MRRLWMLPLLGFGLACARDRTATPAPPPGDAAAPPPAAAGGAGAETMVRGVVRLNPEPSFRPCDGTSQRTLVDETGGKLVSIHSTIRATDEAGLYLFGPGVIEANGSLSLRGLEYASLPGDLGSCSDPEPGYLVMARGKNPAWTLTLTGSGAVLNDSLAGELRFGPAPATDTEGATRYEFGSAAEGHTMQVTLRSNGCAEASGGSYGSMHAEVVIDGRALQGCGWRGRH